MKPAWLVISTVAFSTACSHSRPQPAPPEEKRAGSMVEIGSEAQKNFGLLVQNAAIQNLNEYLQVPGTVQPVDSRVSTVRPLARGRLHDVLVRVGDRVRRGQTLATYDNIEAGELAAQLAAGGSELERLKVQERSLARQAERARALAEIGAVPRKEFEQASADQQALQHSIQAQQRSMAGIQARLKRFGTPPDSTLTALLSPLAGVVTKMDASPGEVIDSASALFTIADLSTVWVQAEVYEKDLGRLRVGQPGLITVETYPDDQFTGKVTYVSDFLDPRTRAAKVRCEVHNAGMLLKLDMYVNVNLPTIYSHRALAVPEGSLQEIDGKTVVFIRKTATQFEPRNVTAGNRVRDLVEISRGLAEGEPVVTAGAFHLKSILVGKELGEE